MTFTPTRPEPGADRASSYVLIVSYTAPLRAVDAAMPAHRRFLDEHFATGEFLASGPREPRIGGVILARFSSRARLTEVVGADPFVRQDLASYEVIAFHPTRGPFALPMSDPTASIPGP
ncbi:YciI family protein [Nocardioides sp.]|uniref:YciI family protein n=1 Tax=Nocardioides sp. TaxID=35761 RepID=UPI003784589E